MIGKFRQQSKPEAINFGQLVKPMLSNYARTNGGSFMLVGGDDGKGYEIHCIFTPAAAPAAAEYAKKLVENFGIPCEVFIRTHRELLNHLATKGSFSYERRSRDRSTV